ncbi:hypothetical protein ACP70R_038436 [Stipagrostis hirtigluma subsp. patula]
MESYKGGGGGEVRRINVVYFLSRGGRTDHPHLFRVNHHSRAGVRLRDVKRWLSELRGKDMPDNFSWSYKRKYKAGYVWQDLKDDDLITPVADNEYVLKGCDVRGTPPPCIQAPKTPSLVVPDEKKRTEKEEKTACNDQIAPVEVVLTPYSDESSPKPPPPPAADQDSPGGCESTRVTAPFKIELSVELHERKQQQREEEEEEEVTKKAITKAAAAERQLQGAAKSHAVAGGEARRMRVARALHNILTCGAADADDAALRPVARRQRRSAAEDWPPTPTCPGMDGCGLRVGRKARARRGAKEKPGKRDRDGGDAHKPATLPRCSQCGKGFKPHELHSHMQSCRGFKERMRSSTSVRVSVDRSHRKRNSAADHCSPEPASAVFLLRES